MVFLDLAGLIGTTVKNPWQIVFWVLVFETSIQGRIRLGDGIYADDYRSEALLKNLIDTFPQDVKKTKSPNGASGPL